MGNGEWGMGNGDEGIVSNPHSPLPTPILNTLRLEILRKPRDNYSQRLCKCPEVYATRLHFSQVGVGPPNYRSKLQSENDGVAGFRQPSRGSSAAIF